MLEFVFRRNAQLFAFCVQCGNAFKVPKRLVFSSCNRILFQDAPSQVPSTLTTAMVDCAVLAAQFEFFFCHFLRTVRFFCEVCSQLCGFRKSLCSKYFRRCHPTFSRDSVPDKIPNLKDHKINSVWFVLAWKETHILKPSRLQTQTREKGTDSTKRDRCRERHKERQSATTPEADRSDRDGENNKRREKERGRKREKSGIRERQMHKL